MAIGGIPGPGMGGPPLSGGGPWFVGVVGLQPTTASTARHADQARHQRKHFTARSFRDGMKDRLVTSLYAQVPATASVPLTPQPLSHQGERGSKRGRVGG